MLTMGDYYAEGNGVPKSYPKARAWYEKAAGAGNLDAMLTIGLLYANGRGVAQDDAKATEWLERSSAGDAGRIYRIGERYAVGNGVPKSYPTARAWLEKAAAAGDARALGNLSWYALLAREHAQALDAAERGLKAHPNHLWIAANRAHALVLLGRAAEARRAYLAYKGRRLPEDNKTWQQSIADDFANLRAAGIEHPQMAEIEAALGTARR
jgi:TPR repeat protein